MEEGESIDCAGECPGAWNALIVVCLWLKPDGQDQEGAGRGCRYVVGKLSGLSGAGS